MNLFEIKPDGHIYIRTDSGTIIREVGDGRRAEFADFGPGEQFFVLTYESGECEVRDVKNRLVKTLAKEGVHQSFAKADGFQLIMQDGSEKWVPYDEVSV